MKKINKGFLILIVVLIILIIFTIIYFLLKNDNKNLNIGNNVSNKSIQEIEEYILNISSYEAKITVTIESNKNTNKYLLEQRYIAPNIENQRVLEPVNIAGLETIYSDGNLKINNTKLNLQTIYENYEYVLDNNLWLNSFINDYKNSNEKNIKEDYNNLIMTATIKQNNVYNSTKTLYVDKKTGAPSKMLVQDKNQNNLVYILYNEIKINGLKK